MPRGRSATREIRVIRRALASIASALGRLAPQLAQPRNPKHAASDRPRRMLKLSAERRAALKLQGEYMGFLRGLKPRQRSQVKALRAAKGLSRAAALAKKLARVAAALP